MNDASAEKPQLCRLCCEFFGNQSTDNLCSKCFKTKSKTASPTIQSTAATISIPQIESKPVEQTIIKEEEKIEEPVKQVDPKKCFSCPKKVGPLGNQCKCGFTFCKSHRLPEDHDCTFDFKAAAAQRLAKENPLVVASKLEKI